MLKRASGNSGLFFADDSTGDFLWRLERCRMKQG